MGLSIDWFGSVIQITSPTVSVDLQTLHDFIEDQMATPVGLQHPAIIQPEGKIEDPTNPGVFSQIIVILNSPWQTQFWGGSGYSTIFGGKLIGGLNDEPVKATGTAGDITVLNSPVDGVTVVTGSGVTAQDKIDIANQVATRTYEGSYTLEDIMRVLFAGDAGDVSGAPSGPILIKDPSTGLITRITATVDANGNRTVTAINVS